MQNAIVMVRAIGEQRRYWYYRIHERLVMGQPVPNLILRVYWYMEVKWSASAWMAFHAFNQLTMVAVEMVHLSRSRRRLERLYDMFDEFEQVKFLVFSIYYVY
jgi:hypothetical protein